MNRRIDIETAVFHYARYGHLNKEGLLCTRCYLTRRRNHRHSIIRSYVAICMHISLSLSLFLWHAISLCVYMWYERAVDSLVNKRARLYLLVTSSSESRLPRLYRQFTESLIYTISTKKKRRWGKRINREMNPASPLTNFRRDVIVTSRWYDAAW